MSNKVTIGELTLKDFKSVSGKDGLSEAFQSLIKLGTFGPPNLRSEITDVIDFTKADYYTTKTEGGIINLCLIGECKLIIQQLPFYPEDDSTPFSVFDTPSLNILMVDSTVEIGAMAYSDNLFVRVDMSAEYVCEASVCRRASAPAGETVGYKEIIRSKLTDVECSLVSSISLDHCLFSKCYLSGDTIFEKCTFDNVNINIAETGGGKSFYSLFRNVHFTNINLNAAKRVEFNIPSSFTRGTWRNESWGFESPVTITHKSMLTKFDVGDMQCLFYTDVKYDSYDTYLKQPERLTVNLQIGYNLHGLKTTQWVFPIERVHPGTGMFVNVVDKDGKPIEFTGGGYDFEAWVNNREPLTRSVHDFVEQTVLGRTTIIMEKLLADKRARLTNNF